MGGPGSGKSVQAARAGAAFHHVSTGEMLRNVARNPQHPKAEYFKRLMSQGTLIPTNSLFKLLNSELTKQSGKVYLLDGFPRTLSQWDLYKQHFGLPLGVIDFHLPQQSMLERLMSRGRMDDTEAVAQSRIKEYYEQTVPVADIIKAECRLTAHTIDADQTIDQVHDDFITSLSAIHPDSNNENLCESNDTHNPNPHIRR